MMPRLRKRKPPPLHASLATADREAGGVLEQRPGVSAGGLLQQAGNRATSLELRARAAREEQEEDEPAREPGAATNVLTQQRLQEGARPDLRQPKLKDMPRREEVEVVDLRLTAKQKKFAAKKRRKLLQARHTRGKQLLTEANVPFHLYPNDAGWIYFGGGETARSSRTSIARRSDADITAGREATAGLDFIAVNLETLRVVLGEQKALKSAVFRDASAITTWLKDNVATASETLQGHLDDLRAHPDTPPDVVLKLEATIAKLREAQASLATADTGKPLPDGVVFEFTAVGGESSKIGLGHVQALKKAFKNPAYVAHLLDRTFVRKAAKIDPAKKPPSAKRGTDTDSDVVPARELLTASAKDAVGRMDAGMTKKQWQKEKERKDADRERTAREPREAVKKELAESRIALQRGEKKAPKVERRATSARLKQLKEAQKTSGGPQRRSKAERDALKADQQRQADEAGTKAKADYLEPLQRRRAEATEKQAELTAARKAAEAEARQKREADRKARKAKERADTMETALRRRRRNAVNREEKVGSTKASTGALKKEVKTRNDEAARPVQEHNARVTREAEVHNAKARRDTNVSKALNVGNKGAALVRAWTAGQEAMDNGEGEIAALRIAVVTYLENTNDVIGAFGNAAGKQADGQDFVEAWLSTGSETIAGRVYGGSPADQAINAFVNVIDAVDDHVNRGIDPARRTGTLATVRAGGDVAADVTPSRLLTQTAGAAARAYYTLYQGAKGNTKSMGRFSDDVLKGKLGSAFVFPALMAEFGSNLASDDAGTALEKAVRKSEGAATTKLGYASGDALYEFGQNRAIKAGNNGVVAQGWSQMVGMASDVIAGNSLQRSMENAAAAGKGSAANRIGEKIADLTYQFGQNEQLKAGKAGMAAQGLSQVAGMASDLIAGASLEKAMQNAAAAGKGSLANKIGEGLADATWNAIEKGQDIVNGDLPAAKKKAKQALNSLVTFLGGN